MWRNNHLKILGPNTSGYTNIRSSGNDRKCFSHQGYGVIPDGILAQ